MSENLQDAFERGHLAGEVAARLANHDKHFADINGHLAELAREMHEQTLALQRLADQASSRDATAVVTAKALKDADEARRAKSESSWSPMAKLLAVVAVLIAAAGAAATWYAQTHHP